MKLLKKRLEEATGVHVGKAYDNWTCSEDREEDEKETEGHAKRSGGDKTLCMKKYKVQALVKAKGMLQSKMSACAKDKNPQKCKDKIQKELSKYDQKIAAAKAKISESTQIKSPLVDGYLTSLHNKK